MLPPSVISMEGDWSQLVLARGIGVTAVGHGLFESSDEYGLLLESVSLFEHVLQQQ